MKTKRCKNCGFLLLIEVFDCASDICKGCVADPGAVDRSLDAMFFSLETEKCKI